MTVYTPLPTPSGKHLGIQDEEAETPEEAQKRVEELNSVGFCTGSHYQYTWDPHRNSLAAAAAASAVRMDLVCSHVS